MLYNIFDMPESQVSETQIATPEVPTHTTTVEFPFLIVGDNSLRLGMHTDSILTLLKTLSETPNHSQVRIQGRQLTPQQQTALEQSSTYRFYLSSRSIREGLYVPPQLNLTTEEVFRLSQTPFTPDSLKGELGFKTTYYDAASLVQDFLNGVTPNKFLPVIGGVNSFQIGSDTLSPEQLNEVKRRLIEAFEEQEEKVRQRINGAPASPLATSRSIIPFIKLFDANKSSDQIFLKDIKHINKTNESLDTFRKFNIELINKSKP